MSSSSSSISQSRKKPTDSGRDKTPEQLLAIYVAKRQAQVIKISQLRQQYYYQMNSGKHAKCPVIIVGRELDVLKLMSEGYSNRVVGEMLSEPKAIIDGYVICLFNKLKSNNRIQATDSAIHLGILET